MLQAAKELLNSWVGNAQSDLLQRACRLGADLSLPISPSHGYPLHVAARQGSLEVRHSSQSPPCADATCCFLCSANFLQQNAFVCWPDAAEMPAFFPFFLVHSRYLIEGCIK